MNEQDLINRRKLFGIGGTMAMAGAVLATPIAAGAAEPMPEGRLLFDVRKFGAVGDGKTKDTAAIQKAIDACSEARGGMVYFLPGDYLIGSIVLKSHVTLYLESAATLLASPDINDYTFYPFTGDPFSSPAPDAVDAMAGGARRGGERNLIFADSAVNVAIMGFGTINGNGVSFRSKIPDAEMAKRWAAPGARMDGGRVLAYWYSPGNRPSGMIVLRRCTGVRLFDVTLIDPPNWTIHPIACDNVFIRGITINTFLGACNSDGIDPDGCWNVMISDCNIVTGDDAICLKNRDQLRLGRPTKNVTVTNCVIETTCNGLKIDEAWGGGFENIAVSNCVFKCASSPDENRMISGIHIDSSRGNYTISGIQISNCSMFNVRSPIFIRNSMYDNRTRIKGYTGGGLDRSATAPGPAKVVIRDVMIDNVYAVNQTITNSITGLPGGELENISLSNIHIVTTEKGNAELAKKSVPELPTDYPEATMFERTPSYGFYFRHVNGLKLRNVETELAEPDMRPAIICDDVKNLDIDGFFYSNPGDGQSGLRLINVKKAFIRGCSPPPGAKTFVQLEGKDTEKIALVANDLSQSDQAVAALDGVSADALFQAANRPARNERP